jgi:predicted DNA-binding protein with PD1-like motif
LKQASIHDLAAHPQVETFAGHLLDDRRNDREVEVRIFEIAGAGRVRRVPGTGVGHHCAH